MNHDTGLCNSKNTPGGLHAAGDAAISDSGEISLENELPISDLARVIAIFYIYMPVVARNYFGSVYDSVLHRESILFEEWPNDPIVAQAFFRQIHGKQINRLQVLQLAERAIVSGRFDPGKFDYKQFPGLMEDIIPALVSHNPKVQEFLENKAILAISG